MTTYVGQLPDLTWAGAAAITKSDATVYSPPLAGIYVGGAGDVAVVMNDGTGPVTFSAVPVGTFMRISVQKVMATGTTATLLIGGH